MKYVVYSYTISILLITIYRKSRVYMITDGKNRIIPGLKYSLISLLFGWWGIPWGPVRTLQSFAINFTGGEEVTEQINKEIYGVSEPNEKWECPRCKKNNPNTSYSCLTCGHKLV